ncbi:hypothetical protein C5E11_00725 [Clavibacter michiganensis]|nr:hypothetical protein C5E11_00725 [Clavibacter michiganensis]
MKVASDAVDGHRKALILVVAGQFDVYVSIGPVQRHLRFVSLPNKNGTGRHSWTPRHSNASTVSLQLWPTRLTHGPGSKSVELSRYLSERIGEYIVFALTGELNRELARSVHFAFLYSGRACTHIGFFTRLVAENKD